MARNGAYIAPIRSRPPLNKIPHHQHPLFGHESGWVLRARPTYWIYDGLPLIQGD